MPKSKGTPHPLMVALNECLNNRGYTLKEVAEQIHSLFIESDKSPSNYYQRLYKLSTGELTTLTDKEAQSIKHITKVLNNPFKIAHTVQSVPNIKGKLSQVSKAIDSRIYNPHSIGLILKELNKLSTLSID